MSLQASSEAQWRISKFRTLTADKNLPQTISSHCQLFFSFWATSDWRVRWKCSSWLKLLSFTFQLLWSNNWNISGSWTNSGSEWVGTSIFSSGPTITIPCFTRWQMQSQRHYMGEVHSRGWQTWRQSKRPSIGRHSPIC